jgi:hypothetical protein
MQLVLSLCHSPDGVTEFRRKLWVCGIIENHELTKLRRDVSDGLAIELCPVWCKPSLEVR